MKPIITIVITILCCSYTFCQQNPAILNFSTTDGGQKVYNAQNEINFNPGYTFSDNNGGLNAFIEGMIPYSAEYNKTSYNQIQIDQSLDVGKTSGVHSVTPSGSMNYTVPIQVPVGTGGRRLYR